MAETRTAPTSSSPDAPPVLHQRWSRFCETRGSGSGRNTGSPAHSPNSLVGSAMTASISLVQDTGKSYQLMVNGLKSLHHEECGFNLLRIPGSFALEARQAVCYSVCLSGEVFMIFSERHLREAREIIDAIDIAPIERMVSILVQVRDGGGQLFFLGVGGGAGNCGHAVNDFRKIVGIEAYAPTDNVSELTARTNDEGWETVFVEWLKVSRLRPVDALFIFSVGGGNLEKNVSPNLVRAVEYAKEVGAYGKSWRRCLD